MNRTSLTVACLTGLAGISLTAPSADAIMLQYEFSGTLDSVTSALAGDFSVGDAFNITYFVETSTPLIGGTLTSGSGFAEYAATSWSATVGGFSVSSADATITILNDMPIDEYRITPDAPFTLSGVPAGFSYVQSTAIFRDLTALEFADTQLITDPAILIGLGIKQFSMAFFNPILNANFSSFGEIDEARVTVIPAPVGTSLGLIGIGTLAIRRRR